VFVKDAAPRVGLVKLPVSDLNRAVAYYRDVLGFEEEFTAPEYGWSSLSAGEVKLGLYVPGMGGGDQTPGGSAGFQLQVHDLTSLHQHLAQRGAIMPEGVYTAADGMRCLIVHDPDGNQLQIGEPQTEA
jgi:catechol 2,3-dioxygenase-like lactoylglutathione lyase family enzyme